MNVKCAGRHTKYQPDDERVVCPECGEKNLFAVDYWDQEANNPNCNLLHVDDVLCCDRCGGMWSGRTLTSIWVRQDKLKTCPTCKGKGHVRKDGSADVDEEAELDADLVSTSTRREPVRVPPPGVLDVADSPQLTPALRASLLMARTYANSFNIAAALLTEEPEAFVQRVARELLNQGRGAEALEVLAGGRFPDEQAERVEDFFNDLRS